MDNDGAASAIALGVALAVFVVALAVVLSSVREASPPDATVEGPPMSAERLSEIFLGRSADAFYTSAGQDLKFGNGTVILQKTLVEDRETTVLAVQTDNRLGYCEVAGASHLSFPASDCGAAGLHGFQVTIRLDHPFDDGDPDTEAESQPCFAFGPDPPPGAGVHATIVRIVEPDEKSADFPILECRPGDSSVAQFTVWSW